MVDERDDDLVCALCGETHPGEFPDLAIADRSGWWWWTGWLMKRQAACPKCLTEQAREVRRLVSESQSAANREEFERLRRDGLVKYDKHAGRWVYAEVT